MYKFAPNLLRICTRDESLVYVRPESSSNLYKGREPCMNASQIFLVFICKGRSLYKFVPNLLRICTRGESLVQIRPKSSSYQYKGREPCINSPQIFCVLIYEGQSLSQIRRNFNKFAANARQCTSTGAEIGGLTSSGLQGAAVMAINRVMDMAKGGNVAFVGDAISSLALCASAFPDLATPLQSLLKVCL